MRAAEKGRGASGSAVVRQLDRSAQIIMVRNLHTPGPGLCARLTYIVYRATPAPPPPPASARPMHPHAAQSEQGRRGSPPILLSPQEPQAPRVCSGFWGVFPPFVSGKRGLCVLCTPHRTWDAGVRRAPVQQKHTHASPAARTLPPHTAVLRAVRSAHRRDALPDSRTLRETNAASHGGPRPRRVPESPGATRQI